MNRHPVSLRGCQTSFLMVCHAILRQILNSSRELSVYVFFYTVPTMCTSSLYGNASSISNDIFGEIVLKYLLGFSKVHSIIKGNQKIELSPAPARPPSQCCLPVDWLGYRRLGSIIFINQTDAPRTSVLTHPSSCWHLC